MKPQRLEMLSSLILLCGFIGMMFFVNLCLLEQPTSQVKLRSVELVMAGISIWLAFTCLSHRTERTPRLTPYRTSVRFILSCLGYVVAFALFFMALILALPIPKQSASQILVQKTFVLDFWMAGYVIFCHLAVWSVYVVKTGIVIIKGRIFYPQERYSILTLGDYDSEVLPEKVILDVQNVVLTCTDGTLNVDLYAAILLNLEEAKKSGVRKMDVKSFMHAAPAWIVGILEDCASHSTINEMVKGSVGEQVATIGYQNNLTFPVKWSGNWRGTWQAAVQ